MEKNFSSKASEYAERKAKARRILDEAKAAKAKASKEVVGKSRNIENFNFNLDGDPVGKGIADGIKENKANVIILESTGVLGTFGNFAKKAGNRLEKSSNKFLQFVGVILGVLFVASKDKTTVVANDKDFVSEVQKATQETEKSRYEMSKDQDRRVWKALCTIVLAILKVIGQTIKYVWNNTSEVFQKVKEVNTFIADIKKMDKELDNTLGEMSSLNSKERIKRFGEERLLQEEIDHKFRLQQMEFECEIELKRLELQKKEDEARKALYTEV